MKIHINKSDLILFTQNMASLLKSGLSLQESLSVCENISIKKQNVFLCHTLIKRINGGGTLSSALKIFETQIPAFYISLVEIGENIGSLADVFERLAEYLREKKRVNDKIRQALIYPIIVLLTAVFVISVIVFFVFPKLESIFEIFTENSEIVAIKVMRIKKGISVLCVLLLCIAFSSMILAVFHKINEKAAFYIDKISLKIPFVKKYIVISNTSDFAYAMKLLCMSYVPFSEAIRRAAEVINNRYYKISIKNVYNKIIIGEDIGIAFKNEKIFPLYLVTWILLAQSTGNIDGVFLQVSEYFKKEFTNMVEEILISAEPVFILFTGIIIFILVGQFVLPVFNLLGTL